MCHDCRRGEPCAFCLAEQHPWREVHVSTVTRVSPWVVACIPDHAQQELAAGAARAAMETMR